VKESKKEAQYTPEAMRPSERCGVCKFYHRYNADMGGCDKVLGTVAEAGWCKHWERKWRLTRSS
jgi:hypothetical protein